MALSSRPFCSCDSQRVSLGDLSAGWRYTTVQAGVVVSKSAVLRAGLHALKAMSPDELRQVFAALEKVKPGRPAKR